MEKNLSINISTDERQVLSIQSKELNLKICENSNEMMLDELVIDTHKKLKIHAKNFVYNEADQEDLAQQTILKILNNEATKEKFAKSNTPVAFAQKILKNLFIDEYRKNKRLVPLEDNKIESIEDVSIERQMEHRDLIKYLNKLDKKEQVILKMFGKDYTYKEMLEDEHLKHFNENSLKTMCHRARLKIAKKMGEKNE